MFRVVLFLIGIAIAATGLSWLADRPGSLIVNWQGYEIETSVFRAVVMLALFTGLAILTWSILTGLWRSPASVGQFFNRRRQVRGLEALSGGMIAIGAGDKVTALQYAVQARKALPNEPLTQLLRAQAAQLSGDRATSRRMFEAMLTLPETEQLGLRGLYLEAEKEGEREAARQFAERSVELNPRLPWAVDALFELQCKDKDWADALKTLGVAKKYGHHDKTVLDRRRAVLMTARALALEDSDPNRAMGLAVDAHHLAHDLVPAGVLAGRMLAARGQTKRATKIIERVWRRSPHPDLAVVYAHARLGDSPRDRLDRVKRLALANPHSIETPIAIAAAAIEAKDFDTARRSLELIDAGRMTQRICTLMARIDGEQNSDKGRVREWLARAVHAPRDPAWVADGMVSERWAPVSPVTGTFDAFQWRVPADALDAADGAVIAAKLEEMMRLGTEDAVPPVALESAAKVVVPAAADEAEHETVRETGREAVHNTVAKTLRETVREAMRPSAASATIATTSGAPRANGSGGTASARPPVAPVVVRDAPSRQADDAEAVTMRPTTARPTSPPFQTAASAAGATSGATSGAATGRAEPRVGGEATRAASVDVVRGKGEAVVEANRSTVAAAAGAVAGAKVAEPVKPVIVPPAAAKPLDPSVFIAPRAPDDPGVKTDEVAGERPKSPPLTVVSGKR